MQPPYPRPGPPHEGGGKASATALETLLIRDRIVVVGVLATMLVLAWGYLAYMAWGMEHMDMGASMAIMPRMTSWQGIDLALVFAMWTVMMIGMMLPSASPMMLMFARINRRRSDLHRPFVATGVFVLGYLAVWVGFSALAALVQWGLLNARLVSPMMQSTSPLLGGALLIAAGAFQFTPLKHACLSRCSSPLSFIMTEWRDGVRGAFVMGVKHGAFCTGCCWLLMALLLVFGVMNLLWIAALTVFVLLEKALPRVRWLSPLTGVVLIVWGIGVASQV